MIKYFFQIHLQNLIRKDKDIQPFLDVVEGSDPLVILGRSHTGKGGKLNSSSFLSRGTLSEALGYRARVCRVQPVGLAICLFCFYYWGNGLPIYVNKVLFGHSHAPSFMYCLWLLCKNRVELCKQLNSNQNSVEGLVLCDHLLIDF